MVLVWMHMTLNGQLLRDYMTQNAKTREWIAVQLGISVSLLNRMLAGSVPKARTIEGLAQLIGCQVQDLLIAPKGSKKSA